DTGDFRPQRADATTDQLDFHASLTGAIEGLNDGRLEQAVDFGDDAAAAPLLLRFGFLMDFFEEEGLHAALGVAQVAPLRQLAIAGEVVEESGNIVAEFVVAGE